MSFKPKSNRFCARCLFYNESNFCSLNTPEVELYSLVVREFGFSFLWDGQVVGQVTAALFCVLAHKSMRGRAVALVIYITKAADSDTRGATSPRDTSVGIVTESSTLLHRRLLSTF